MGLSAWEVGVVKLRQHIDRAGAVEVVSDGTRTADRNLVACLAPTIQRCGLRGRAMVVQQPHGLLIAPHCNCGVALLSLDPWADSGASISRVLNEMRTFLMSSKFTQNERSLVVLNALPYLSTRSILLKPLSLLGLRISTFRCIERARQWAQNRAI